MILPPQRRLNSNKQYNSNRDSFAKTFLWLLNKLQVFQTVYSDLSDAEKKKENLRDIDAKIKLRDIQFIFSMYAWMDVNTN